MSEYSVKEAREAASATIGKVRGMLTAYADLLEQIERAREGVSDAEIMAEWVKADGSVHGPNVETVTMPQAKYLAFRRSVAHLLPSGERGGVDDAVPLSRYIPCECKGGDDERETDYIHGWNSCRSDVIRRVFGTPPAQAAQVDAWQIVCDSIRKYQFSDELRRGRMTVDVETLLGEINALRDAKPTAEPVAQGEAVARVHSFAGLQIVENADVPDGEIWVYDKSKITDAAPSQGEPA